MAVLVLAAAWVACDPGSRDPKIPHTHRSRLPPNRLRGSAMAKVVSVGTDLGARTALRRGAAFFRAALLVVVLALVGRLAHHTWM